MKAALLLAAGAALGSWSAGAAADPRISTHFFREREIVAVHGREGLQSTIAFDPGERIENVAVGDASAWQVVPNKRADLLFVRPIKPRARTNMTVVTDRHTYLFDLIGGAETPVYMLAFTYPVPPPPPVPPAVKSAQAAVPPAPPAAVTPPPPAPAALNFAWDMHGARQLFPAHPYDDGRSTYLSWPHDVALPAILVREPGGIEGPVNYTVHGDTVVVDGVPAQIVLRSGKQMATLTPLPRTASVPSATHMRAPTPSLPESSSVPTPIRLPERTASSQP